MTTVCKPNVFLIQSDSHLVNRSIIGFVHSLPSHLDSHLVNRSTIGFVHNLHSHLDSHLVNRCPKLDCSQLA